MSKAQAGHLTKIWKAHRAKKVPLSEYHGRGTGSNPDSWNSKGRCATADREIADCNAVIDGDERRPAAMMCEEKIHEIIVDEFIRVRNNLFWNDTCFKAPRVPAFAMEAARELLAFAKVHIGPSMVTKVSAWAAGQSMFGGLPRCASGNAYTLVHMIANICFFVKGGKDIEVSGYLFCQLYFGHAVFTDYCWDRIMP
jgi:hypothetical protein